jgi:siroheme synthase-like protein
MDYYPVFLNLRGRRCVVVGGGKIAEGKVTGLLEAEARVRVIAPELTTALAEWARAGRLEHDARRYAVGDLAGAFLIIGATDEPAINQQVWEEGEALGVLVNVVDDPPHCNFIAPAVVRQGPLAVAISTGGRAPVLAVRLKEQIQAMLGPEHARFLELAGSLRGPLAERLPEFAARRALWYELVDSDVLALLRQGEDEQARARMAEIMGVAPAP